MKINSVTTAALSRDRKIVSQSRTTFKRSYKPAVVDTYNIFNQMETNIRDHMKHDTDVIVERFVVTISTTKGKFIQTYKQGCFK